MNNKVLLILVDGMKGDSVLSCGNKFAAKMVKESTSKLDTQTVMPSVTLPCHMSLFHSVPPERHGILSNTYTPQVRPVKSLINLLSENNKVCSMFYDWEELRDLSRPGALSHSLFTTNDIDGLGDEELTDGVIEYINSKNPDFIFLYYGTPDEVGHKFGWESEHYKKSINHSWNFIEKVYNAIPDDYTIIITADHGGHLRGHGDNIAKDMTIPLIIHGEGFDSNKELPANTTIMDIAPTITKIFDITADKDWEGKSLI